MAAIVRLAVLALLLLAAGPAQAAANARAAEEQIPQLEAAWNEAHLHGDVDALDRLWAPSLSVVVPGMPPFKKQELLGMWRSMRVVFTDYSTSDVVVQVYGTTAVVTGRLHRSRDFGGRVATEDWLFTKTYAEIEGQWRVVAYHASETPTP
jgi:ketosteroid isomerase-like protein